MYVLNTTRGWNVGDDIIRVGVCKLIGITPSTPVIYASRAQCFKGLSWEPAWKIVSRVPWDEIMMECDGYVVCGSPEWIYANEEMYQFAAQFKKPVWIVGVGQRGQKLGFVRKCAKHLKGVTTRDNIALKDLRRAGVKAERHPDPGFMTRGDNKPTGGLVINFRREGSPRKYFDTDEKLWIKIAQVLKGQYDLVTVHEPGEISVAKRIFGTKIFCSQDPEAYLEIYRNCRALVTGRIHAAVPALDRWTRVAMVYRRRKGNDTLKWLPLPNLALLDPGQAADFDFSHHFSYPDEVYDHEKFDGLMTKMVDYWSERQIT